MPKINFPMDDIDPRTITSAQQISEAYEKAKKKHQAQIQVFQAQIDTAQSVAEQQKQIDKISLTISELLKLNLLASKHNEKKEKLESRRFWTNFSLAFVAAAASVWALFK